MTDPIVEKIRNLAINGTPEEKEAAQRLIRIGNLLAAGDKAGLVVVNNGGTITMTGTPEQWFALLA